LFISCRRHAGDGEDAAQAVGAGGGAIHAESPLKAGHAVASACLHWEERGEDKIIRDAEERNPAGLGSQKQKKAKKRISVTRVWWAAAFHSILSWTPANQLSLFHHDDDSVSAHPKIKKIPPNLLWLIPSLP
jgi:hypothetical protein